MAPPTRVPRNGQAPWVAVRPVTLVVVSWPPFDMSTWTLAPSPLWPVAWVSESFISGVFACQMRRVRGMNAEPAYVSLREP